MIRERFANHPGWQLTTMMTLWQKNAWLLILLLGLLGVLPDAADQFQMADRCASPQEDRDDRDEETDAFPALTAVAAASVIVHARGRLGVAGADPRLLRRATSSHASTSTQPPIGILSPAGYTPAPLRI